MVKYLRRRTNSLLVLVKTGSIMTQMRKKGRLEVVCGSMFSGKTEELMRRVKRAEYARQNVLTLKHQLDQRKSHTRLVSHGGIEHAALPIQDNQAAFKQILELAMPPINVVGIDEIQFFPHGIIEVITQLVDRGNRVIVAGLDLDFRGEPFGIMPALLSIADEVLKLKAICVLCGSDAHHTQRLINGAPASYHDPIILVGAEEYYEARCRDCFQIDTPALIQPALHQAAL